MDPNLRKPVMTSFGCAAVLGAIMGIAFAMGIAGILVLSSEGPITPLAVWLDILVVPIFSIATGIYFARRELSERIQEFRLRNCLCKRCGYDLRGSVDIVCPECGTGVPDRQRRRINKIMKNPPK